MLQWGTVPIAPSCLDVAEGLRVAWVCALLLRVMLPMLVRFLLFLLFR
jgi:hypothetical protein